MIKKEPKVLHEPRDTDNQSNGVSLLSNLSVYRISKLAEPALVNKVIAQARQMNENTVCGVVEMLPENMCFKKRRMRRTVKTSRLALNCFHALARANSSSYKP